MKYLLIITHLVVFITVSCSKGKHIGKPKEYVIYSNIQRVYQSEMRAKESRYTKRCPYKLTYKTD